MRGAKSRTVLVVYVQYSYGDSSVEVWDGGESTVIVLVQARSSCDGGMSTVFARLLVPAQAFSLRFLVFCVRTSTVQIESVRDRILTELRYE